MKKIVVGIILGIFYGTNLFAGDFELAVEALKKKIY